MNNPLLKALADADTIIASNNRLEALSRAQFPFQLKLADGTVVTANGTDAEHAAARYADLHDVEVIATRPVRHGLSVLGAGRIVG